MEVKKGKKEMKKALKIILCVFMLSTIIHTPVKIYAKSTNIALGKPVSVSGVEGGKQADGSYVYPQFDPSNLTDGNRSTRWSSDLSLTTLNLQDNPNQNVWAMVDLQNVTEIERVVLKWQHANSRNYDIQVSTDGTSWTTIGHYEDANNFGKEYIEELILDTPVNARYIRVYARLATYSNLYWVQFNNISLYEIEAYEWSSSEMSIERALNQALRTPVTANEAYTQLNLPTVDGYKITIQSSSNSAVVDEKGKITRPLEDVRVNLFYQVCKLDGSECIMGDEPAKVEIQGQYKADQSINEKPKIVPEIREWKGNEGKFVYNGRIVIVDKTLQAVAEQIAMYFKEMVSISSEIIVGKPQAGDLYLVLDPNSVLGNEGYEMDIADVLTIRAKTEKGILYGGTSVSQMFTLADDHQSAPKGLVRDYPQYEIRAVMLDVARQYIPLDYLEELTKYAGYFKLSEFRNHINDAGGEQQSAFRVESKKYPQLNEGITYYSQEDYIAYQKEVKKFGIDVVSEIDTPGHATVFAKIDPSVLTDDLAHLDIRTDESYQKAVTLMKSVFDEFLDGDDPVFQNYKVNIGTDEYDRTYSEQARKYTDEMIRYVSEKGFEARFWASLGTAGFNGTTPVSTNGLAHYWSQVWASFNEMKEDGYRFINNADGILYIVPWANYYHDRLDIKSLYDTWEVTDFQGYHRLAAGHPQLAGAESALWYDAKVGASEFDIFDRLRDQIMLMAEKTWYGDKDDETGEEFITRVEAVKNKAPQANPARYVEAEKNTIVAAYDFNDVVNGKVSDLSGNGYDAQLHDAYIKNNALRLNGEGYLSLPFDSIGYPYSVQFDLYVDSVTPSNAVLFEGTDGKLIYDYDGTSKFGYQRKGYTYLFNYEVETDTTLTVTLTCDQNNTYLYINGNLIGAGAYYQVTANAQNSSTFVLPTEKIGQGVFGYLDNLKIYNYILSPNQVLGYLTPYSTAPINVALNKTATASGIEGGYLDDGTLKNPHLGPQMVVDGDFNTRASLEQADEAWITVDLGKNYLIQRTWLEFLQLPNAYDLQISENGENWTTIDHRSGLAGSTYGGIVTFYDAPQKARYVKYQQRERFTLYNVKWSGCLLELQVYGYDLEAFEAIIANAEKVLAETEKNAQNEALLTSLASNAAKLKEMMKVGPASDLGFFADLITEQIDMLKQEMYPSETVDRDALETLLNEKLDQNQYDTASWNVYQQALGFGKKVYYNVLAKQNLIDYAVKIIENAKDNLEMKPWVSISSNKGLYTGSSFVNVIDGDLDTFTFLEYNQMAGEYLLFTFRDVMKLSSIQIVSLANWDDIQHGRVEWSKDGVNWTSLGDIGGQVTENLTFDEIEAKYVRILVTADAPKWWRICEVVFNDEYVLDKKVLKKELESKEDERLYTAESFAVLVEAKESGQAIYDDPKTSQPKINDAVEQIREARKNLVKILNKAELQELIDHKTENNERYTVSSYTAYEKAYAAGAEVLNDEDVTQSDVDIAVWRIQEAISNLQKSANKNELKALVAAVENMDLTGFTPETVDYLQDVLAEAKVILEDEHATQQQVDEVLIKLQEAISGLREKADKQALNELVEAYEQIDLDLYSDSSKERFEATLEKAKEILKDENAVQEDVDAMIKMLEEAYTLLERSVDKYELDEALNKARAINTSQYPVELVEVLNQAMEALLKGVDTSDYLHPSFYMLLMVMSLMVIVSMKKKRSMVI